MMLSGAGYFVWVGWWITWPTRVRLPAMLPVFWGVLRWLSAGFHPRLSGSVGVGGCPTEVGAICGGAGVFFGVFSG